MIDDLPETGKRAVIIQPSYLPWRGFFHLLYLADIWVFLDDVQYDKDSWRNRNRIKGGNGSFWLTVPVQLGGWPPPPIVDVRIDNTRDWRRKHLMGIRQSYAGSPFADEHLPLVGDLLERDWESISDLDIEATSRLATALGFERPWLRSSQMDLGGDPTHATQRLIRVCQEVGATQYLSGPSARDYIDAPALTEVGIDLRYMEYEYPPYPQRFGEFISQLSVLDLLFNCGPEAGDYIWGPKARAHRTAMTGVAS